MCGNGQIVNYGAIRESETRTFLPKYWIDPAASSMFLTCSTHVD
jgi:hypothetical protein